MENNAGKTLLEERENEEQIKDSPDYTIDKIHHQALIILFGLGNQGKTSTLTDLLFLLTNVDVANYVNNNFISKKKQNHYQDNYYVLHYNDSTIFIATYGDGSSECERNQDFFEHKPIDKPIYIIEGINVKLLKDLPKKEQKSKYYKQVPDFCIAACRTEGGSVDATLYIAKKFLPHIKQEVWIRKIGMQPGESPDYINPSIPIITKKDDILAKEILALINRLRKGNSI